MARYRKKALVDAVKIMGADYIHPNHWPDGLPFSETPNWLLEAFDNGKVVAVGIDTDYAVWDIHSLEGVLRAVPDDYILHGIEGEIWPVRGDIFEKTYTLVEEGEKE